VAHHFVVFDLMLDSLGFTLARQVTWTILEYEHGVGVGVGVGSAATTTTTTNATVKRVICFDADRVTLVVVVV
jgi:hypothetical protein